MPGRRRITIAVGALGAAALAVVGAMLFLRGERGGEHAARDGAARSAVVSRGDDDSGPRSPAPDSAVPAGAPGNSASERALDGVPATAQRDAEPQPEVTFSGLVHVEGLTEEEAKLGTIVLRGDESLGAPARIELPIRHGRFSGVGPMGATVVVERLTFGARKLATVAGSWKLASRWIQVYGTLAPLRLLHVVDEGGRELSHVVLLDAQHVEGAIAAPGGLFRVMDRFGTRDPAAGSDSPLRIAAFPASTLRRWNEPSFRDENEDEEDPTVARQCIVHVPDRGVEFVRFAEDEMEKRVVMRGPATVRVHVTPWPLAVAEENGARSEARASVVLALLVPEEPARSRDRPIASKPLPDSRADVADADELPSEVRAQLSAAALARVRVSIESRQRYARTIASPLRHAAAVDESGIATFPDVGQGEWVAWCTDGRDDDRYNVALSSRRGARKLAAAHRHQLASFSTTAGGAVDVTVQAVPREPELCTLVVHATSAADGAAVASGAESVAVYPLESDVLPSEPFKAGSRDTGDAQDDGKDDDESENAELKAPVGLAWVIVAPGVEHGLASTSVLVDLAPGRNDVAIKLPALQGVQVEFRFDDAEALTSDLSDTLARVENISVRQGDAEVEPRYHMDDRTCPPQVFLVFGPLASGRCELIVPDEAGFDRPGTTTLEVAEHQLTKITLRSTLPSVAERRAGK